VVASLLFAAPASAQQKEPIGKFAVDLRGIFARHKVEPDIAKGLGVTTPNLPVRSFGLVAGGQYYFFHSSKITLGAGGEMVLGRGSRTLDLPDPTDPTMTTKSPTVRRHFTSYAPEVSLNFGHRNGWSYISGGMFGRARVYADRLDKPATDSPLRATINYGGGARWFTSERLAFSVDFRWYSIAEQPQTATAVLQPRTTLLVLSGGIAIK
jgi:hypothetical protein